MRKTLIASALALLGLAAVPVRAMPFPPFSDAPSAATMVAFGCGLGWTRGPYGHCHPMGWGHPVYGYGSSRLRLWSCSSLLERALGGLALPMVLRVRLAEISATVRPPAHNMLNAKGCEHSIAA